VLGVTYSLELGGAARITYADVKRYFGDFTEHPTLQQTRDAVRSIRHSKAMLIVEGDDDCRSAGSFFKNSIVDAAKYDEIAAAAAKQGSSPPPKYPADAGRLKLSAAWLVEQSGFAKGYTRGKAAISSKHTLALVNRGGATAAEILALRDEVQQGVREAFGIELQPEPVMVGF
jgi:UDP-N-acetylmuramate dehydrogenase